MEDMTRLMADLYVCIGQIEIEGKGSIELKQLEQH